MMASILFLKFRPSIIFLATILFLTISPMVLAVFNMDGNSAQLQMKIKKQDEKIELLETSNRDLKEQNKDLNQRLTILEERFNQLPATNENMLNELIQNKMATLIQQMKKDDNCENDEISANSKEKSRMITRNCKVSTASSGVHFFVQRKSSWTEVGIIPFEIETLNVGGAMNLSTGIFTTPKTGIYHFSFTGIKDNGWNTYVDLRLNFKRSIVFAYGDNSSPWGTLTFTATIKLQTGDTISVVKNDSGVLYDSSNPYTSFTGSLLMEEHSSD